MDQRNATSLLTGGQKLRKDVKAENEKKKEYLRSYLRAKSQVHRIVLRIDELRLDKMCPSVCNDGMPRGNTQNDLSAYAAKLDAEIQKLYKARYKKICIFKEINDKIERLEDEHEKDVLTYRYIKGLPWEDICVSMGYTWQHIHRIHSKALENFKM